MRTVRLSRSPTSADVIPPASSPDELALLLFLWSDTLTSVTPAKHNNTADSFVNDICSTPTMPPSASVNRPEVELMMVLLLSVVCSSDALVVTLAMNHTKQNCSAS